MRFFFNQTLLRDPHVLEEGLEKLNGVLQKLEPLHQPLESPGGSVLLHELASVAHLPDATLSPQATPLLHALSSAHAYIMMFVHVCRMGQVRNMNFFIAFVRNSLSNNRILDLTELKAHADNKINVAQISGLLDF